MSLNCKLQFSFLHLANLNFKHYYLNPMKKIYSIAIFAGLLFASCGKSKTEILQDGPWNVTSGKVAGAETITPPTSWTFAAGGNFTETSPGGVQTGTYIYNDKDNKLTINAAGTSPGGINFTVAFELSVSQLEEKALAASGPFKMDGNAMGNISIQAAR